MLTKEPKGCRQVGYELARCDTAGRFVDSMKKTRGKATPSSVKRVRRLAFGMNGLWRKDIVTSFPSQEQERRSP